MFGYRMTLLVPSAVLHEMQKLFAILMYYSRFPLKRLRITIAHLVSAVCLRGKMSRRRTDYEKAVPQLRRLVAGFEPRPGHVGFVVDKVDMFSMRMKVCKLTPNPHAETQLPTG
jgi:hypothetical protein